jgi:hypothetical protein
MWQLHFTFCWVQTGYETQPHLYLVATGEIFLLGVGDAQGPHVDLSSPSGSEFMLCLKYMLRKKKYKIYIYILHDHLCGLVVRVLGYRSRGPGSIPSTTRQKKVVGLERGPLSLVSTCEELLDRKIVAPV